MGGIRLPGRNNHRAARCQREGVFWSPLSQAGLRSVPKSTQVTIEFKESKLRSSKNQNDLISPSLEKSLVKSQPHKPAFWPMQAKVRVSKPSVSKDGLPIWEGDYNEIIQAKYKLNALGYAALNLGVKEATDPKRIKTSIDHAGAQTTINAHRPLILEGKGFGPNRRCISASADITDRQGRAHPQTWASMRHGSFTTPHKHRKPSHASNVILITAA